MRLILTAQLVKKGPNVKFCFIETPQDLYQMTLDLFVFLCPNVSSEHAQWPTVEFDSLFIPADFQCNF